MIDDTITAALIYEQQGLRAEAMEIYKRVLERDPSSEDALAALRRLNTQTQGVNAQMLEFFVSLSPDAEVKIREFKRWLIKI